MKFRIEALVKLGIERYRLQKDETWKHIGSDLTRNSPKFDRIDHKSPDDLLFDDLLDAGHYISGLPGKIKLGNKKYEYNKSSGSLQEIHMSAEIKPRVYRLTKPRKFSEEEVRTAIRLGKDNVNNTLIVDLEGRVKLKQFNTFAVSDMVPIAVRNEAFCAGNEYVGIEAAADDKHVRKQYISLLEGWIVHLLKGDLNVFQGYVVGKMPEKELWKEVEYLTKHLK